MKENKDERPVLKIKLTLTDRLLEMFGWLILILLWTWLLVDFSSFPEIIPLHYNLAGQPDSFRNNALIFSILSTVLFVGMTLLNKFPHVFNYPKKITNQNAERQYTIATRLVRYLKFIVVFTFSIVVFMTAPAEGGIATCPGSWFILIFIGLIYVPMTFAIVKLFKVP